MSDSTTDDILAQAFPATQHPVKAWRLVARAEALWPGPTSGTDERRPKSGPARETYAEHVNRVANEKGYTSGFGLSQVYAMLKRVKHLDALDPAILDYLERLPIPRAGLASVLDKMVDEKGTAELVMQSAKDWLAERGAYARAEKPDVSPVEKAMQVLRSLVEKLPVDTIDGKHFRAEALELLRAS